MSLILFKNYLGIQLVYNVLLASSAQQSEYAVCLHSSLLFWISFPFRSQSTEQGYLCYIEGSHQLSTLYIVSMAYYMPIPISQFIPPPFLPLDVCTFALYSCVSISAQQIRLYIPFFSFHIYSVICNICFSLSYLLPSV